MQLTQTLYQNVIFLGYPLIWTESELQKIAEFWLAKAYHIAGKMDSQITGDIRGTLGFMPRQLVLDYKYQQPNVDVWVDGSIAVLYANCNPTPRTFRSGRKS